MLSWVVLLLAPVSVIIAVAATPVASLLLAGAPRCAHAAIVAVSSRMLVVFAPQILLYGLAVVFYGILQAHRRFTAPALAPVLSSVVVISAYLAFVPLSQGYGGLATLPRSAELMLSVGTTAGVAALALTALVPVLRLRLRLRPTLRFPAGVAPPDPRPGRGGADRPDRPGRVGGRGDGAGQRPGRPGRAGPVQLRLADVLRALRGARGAHRHHRVPAPGGGHGGPLR